MSGQIPVSDTFWPLLDSAGDGTLVETQLQELATLLNSDLTARRIYLDHVELWTTIRMLVRAERACDAGLAQVQATFPQVSPSSSAAPALGFLSTTLPGTLGYFPEGMPLAYLIATVIFGVGLLIGSHIYVSQSEQVVRQSASLPSPLSPLPSVVGRITGMVDCKWKKGLGIGDWGLEKGSGFRGRGTGTENRQSSSFNP